MPDHQKDIFNFSPPNRDDAKYEEWQHEVKRCKAANAFWHKHGFGHPVRMCKWRAEGISGYGLRLKHNGMCVPEAQHYNAKLATRQELQALCMQAKKERNRNGKR